ncbi:FAD-binding oxidoreductase [Luteimonas sp BLCC-B24]|uniref:ferredoxin reductase n=1 Tax=Luteimonas sp. BLCC-B24 TaxID=3025317 RepID=UPI00234C68DA|nr:FAD-binding oxidoreductase [Luteimonas sp. BLCC-B24]MDC7806701.1 FAD-binding oxidoreductase [Luteimonas sp. BLCC-B24]
MSAVTPVPTRPRSRLRRLAAPFVAPPVFDFWAQRLHPTWTWERPLARIVGHAPAAAGAVTLTLTPNRHWAGARPGQHVNLGADIDGVRVTRSYSLDAPVAADGRITITVKGIEGGRMSRHLLDPARIGDVLDIGPGFGDMTLDPAAAGVPRLLLAGGSGITPLMALVRQLAGQGMPAPVTLLYWARTRAEFCFADELRALAARQAGFDLRFMLTGEAPAADDEAAGRIEAEALASLVPDLAARHVDACGPGGFVAAAEGLLTGRVAALRSEAFTPPPRPPADDTGTVAVRLLRSGRDLQLPRGIALLEALEAAGVKPRSGCRMGICNTCACGKSAGTARDLRTGAANGEPTQALKLCINSAVSDLVLDL